MAYEHRVNTILYVDNVPIPSAGITETFTAAARASVTESVPGGSTDLQVNISIDVSEVSSLFMYCARDITIETNSGSAPAATIALKAGQPLHWQPNSYYTNPLGATDVTAIFATLAAGDAADLVIEVLQDPTP